MMTCGSDTLLWPTCPLSALPLPDGSARWEHGREWFVEVHVPGGRTQTWISDFHDNFVGSFGKV